MNKTKIGVVVSVLLVLAAFVESKFDLLQDVGLSIVTINRIKLVGLLLAAVLPSIKPLFSKEDKG
ncbi:MAG: hypothetical protein ABIP27_16545 [Flavobacterium circumlabens]|uniref:hypothetical protein n=1 Tax=Flavobacterium circumlabens TaxID=2133765 RepID=UPI00326569B6